MGLSALAPFIHLPAEEVRSDGGISGIVALLAAELEGGQQGNETLVESLGDRLLVYVLRRAAERAGHSAGWLPATRDPRSHPRVPGRTQQSGGQMDRRRHGRRSRPVSRRLCPSLQGVGRRAPHWATCRAGGLPWRPGDWPAAGFHCPCWRRRWATSPRLPSRAPSRVFHGMSPTAYFRQSAKAVTG
jgi:hypothetical protein